MYVNVSIFIVTAVSYTSMAKINLKLIKEKEHKVQDD